MSRIPAIGMPSGNMLALPSSKIGPGGAESAHWTPLEPSIPSLCTALARPGVKKQRNLARESKKKKEFPSATSKLNEQAYALLKALAETFKAQSGEVEIKEGQQNKRRFQDSFIARRLQDLRTTDKMVKTTVVVWGGGGV